jgi:hypothetical protein
VDDETDWYVIQASPLGVPLAIGLVARDVSPFSTSTPEVILRAYTDPSQAPIAEASFGMAGPDPTIYPSALLAAPGAPLYVEVERAIGSDAHTAYWLNVRPWLIINEVRLWEAPGSQDAAEAYHGAFVELAGPSVQSATELGVPLTGCELRLLVNDATHETIDLSARSLTPIGFYVLAHDDSVPGTGTEHISDRLAFPVGSTGAHAVQLWCGGYLLDAVQLTGAAGHGGEGAPLLPPALTTTAMGRGFRIDTGDNRRNFLPQLEPSPWARNVSEVR